MRPIQQVVRSRNINVDELRHWAEREAQPVLKAVRDFCNAILGSAELSSGLVVDSEWLSLNVGRNGGALPDSNSNVSVSDGAVRTILSGGITAPRTYTMLATFGTSHRQGFQLWKFDVSYAVTLVAGADSVTVPAEQRAFVECTYNIATGQWSILRQYELVLNE